MKKILLPLILTAFALPVHAAQMSIEERDDVYIIEYRGDSSVKATEPEENPAAAASGEPQEQSAPADIPTAEPAPVDQPTAQPPADQPIAQPEAAEPAPE